MALHIVGTSKFSVWERTDARVGGGHSEGVGSSGENEGAWGDDVPLSDLAVQVLMESLGLAPRSATKPVAVLERIPLPGTLPTAIIEQVR